MVPTGKIKLSLALTLWLANCFDCMTLPKQYAKFYMSGPERNRRQSLLPVNGSDTAIQGPLNRQDILNTNEADSFQKHSALGGAQEADILGPVLGPVPGPGADSGVFEDGSAPGGANEASASGPGAEPGSSGCDRTRTVVHDTWAECYKHYSLFRKCRRCGPTEYWTGRWCDGLEGRLECRECPSPTESNTTNQLEKFCTNEDKPKCPLAEQRKCKEGCETDRGKVVCTCLGKRQLNADGRTCYDAVTLDIEIVLKRMSLPNLDQDAESTVDFHRNLSKYRSLETDIDIALDERINRVTKISMWSLTNIDGNVEAKLSVVMNRTGDEFVASKLTGALLNMVTNGVRTRNGVFQLAIKSNGLPVNPRTDRCAVMSSLQPCGPGKQCTVIQDLPTCRALKDSREDTNVGHDRLGLTIIALVLTVTSLSVVCTASLINENIAIVRSVHEHLDFAAAGSTELPPDAFSRLGVDIPPKTASASPSTNSLSQVQVEAPAKKPT